jgi:hypothetical protein
MPMTKKNIKCEVCGEIVGSLEKNVITQEDRDLYRQMIMCPNGHIEASLAVSPEEEPPP